MRRAVCITVIANIFFGLTPVYWKFLSEVDNLYILGHRMLWSILFTLIFAAVDGKLALLRQAFHNRRALLISLASGVTYALYIILLDYFRLESLSRFKLSFYISATCAAVMLVVCLVTGTFRLPGNALCLGVCFLTAFLAGAAANVLFQNGTLIIGGQRASILSTFEPITSIVTGVLIFSDPFTLRSALGTVCVLAATVLIAVFDMRTQAQRQGAVSTSSLPNPDDGSPAIREEHKGGSQ